MLSICLGFSAVFLIVVNSFALSRTRAQAAGVPLVGILGIFFLLSLGWVILLLNVLFVVLAWAICWSVGARFRWFAASTLGATVAAYALVVCVFVVPELRDWSRLQKEYPVESLAERLAYEDKARAAPRNGVEPSPGQIPTTRQLAHLAWLEVRLQDEERRWETASRIRSLKHLHAGIVQQFIESPGFGVWRSVTRPAPFYLEERDKEWSIPQPTPPYSPLETTAPMPAATKRSLLTAHEANTVDFLNPFGYGYIQDREHVVGFRPHAFRSDASAPKCWKVARLELVGLLKDNNPVVYLSANLPRMDELSKAPTRPLDTFEREALVALQRGEDLLVQEAPRQMRVLGSIRAVQQCVRCHRVERGELLGAFSYRMSPE